tara:strand:- start:5754 stop:6341 length:588 start_codon:yes stop_codon:yes gene_type:complete
MLKKISNDDWQFVAPSLICTICFVLTDFLGIIEKTSIAYWSGLILFEPYRVVTFHFFHGDFNHLLANISGILIARYFLKSLGLKNNSFFIVFICFVIPLQSLILWSVDIFVYRNLISRAIGFSGVLLGIDAFILLTTIYGKKRFFLIECDLKRSYQFFKSMALLTGFFLLWSFLPGVSLLGHLSGFVAGALLFLL